MSRHRILTTRDVRLDQIDTLRPISYDDYCLQGGYTSLMKAVQIGPAQTLEMIRASEIRGRGGAGFSTGEKWNMVFQQKGDCKYLCCNAAEDEPGTFKDRTLLRANPHQVIEGTLIAAYTVGAKTAYIYVNGNYEEEAQFLELALQEAKSNGHWGQAPLDIELTVTKSPGTYVAGEETALLEVIEGRTAIPRQKPPYYPAVHGLFGKPTVVNNAETLSTIPHILAKGPDWFKSIGVPKSWGTMLFTVTGDVNQPGVYELPLGVPLKTLIETHAGGMKDKKQIKAIFPGGPSNAIITHEQIETSLDFDSLRAIGSGLGTGAVIVMSEETCMVRTAITYSRFFSKESCGQCPPCVLGTAYLSEILEKIESGQGGEKDIQQIEQVCGMIKGKGYCYLLTGATIAVESIFRHFKDEFHLHVQEARCPFLSRGRHAMMAV